jgi:hypothetical protein
MEIHDSDAQLNHSQLQKWNTNNLDVILLCQGMTFTADRLHVIFSILQGEKFHYAFNSCEINQNQQTWSKITVNAHLMRACIGQNLIVFQ